VGGSHGAPRDEAALLSCGRSRTASRLKGGVTRRCDTDTAHAVAIVVLTA